MARALAHERTSVAAFRDPVALALLPDESRARVERARAGVPPVGRRERLERAFMEQRAHMMVARTVEIDAAVREAPTPQVVILGAGLDGRAWRMQELGDRVVFEVDHPDSQRDKRARVASLPAVAKEVRFVGVDFARDDLEGRLQAAGHDPAVPTTWIWEGVVMYLAAAEIRATLAVVQRRSPAGSRLVVAYFQPAMLLWFVRLFLARVGEPLRSTHTAAQMADLLAAFGFRVGRDVDLLTVASALGVGDPKAMRRMRHLRIATADRA
jgi:methyltransferase (TIGR00027 family)